MSLSIDSNPTTLYRDRRVDASMRTMEPADIDYRESLRVLDTSHRRSATQQILRPGEIHQPSRSHSHKRHYRLVDHHIVDDNWDNYVNCNEASADKIGNDDNDANRDGNDDGSLPMKLLLKIQRHLRFRRQCPRQDQHR